MSTDWLLDSESDEILTRTESKHALSPKPKRKRSDELAFQAPTWWDEQDDIQITTLWAENHSSAEIGRRMGRSKNSIVGRSHRLRLPARKSPIKYGGMELQEIREIANAKARAKRAAERSTLPPLASVASGFAAPVETPIVLSTPRAATAVPRVSRAVRAPTVTLVGVKREPEPVRYGRVIECQTVTDPGRWGVGITFCSEPSVPGRVYCLDCCKRYYVKPPSRGALNLPLNVGGVKVSEMGVIR